MGEVRLARRAAKEFKALPRGTSDRVMAALVRLEKNPQTESLDVKALVGRRPWRRLRVGDYRVLFRPIDGGRVLLVARIIDRKDLARAVESLPD